MAAFLIDAFVSFVSNFIIIFIGYAIVKLFKKKSIKPMPFVVIAIVSTAITTIAMADYLSKGKYTFQNGALLDGDKDFKRIMQYCLSGKKISNVDHAEFWQLVESKNISEMTVAKMITEFYNPVLLEYQKLFWQDALISLQNKRLNKSDTRNKIEQEMLSNDLISEERIRQNDNLLFKITNSEPVSMSDTTLIYDELAIYSTYLRLDSIFILAKENFEFLKDKNAFRHIN